MTLTILITSEYLHRDRAIHTYKCTKESGHNRISISHRSYTPTIQFFFSRFQNLSLSPTFLAQYKDLNVTSNGIRTTATSGFGLLSKIFSILSKTSGVNFGSTSSALRLSMTCSGREAPKMTVLVLGCLATQARAR